MEKEPYISEILTKITAFSDGMVILFGSHAAGTATGDSDIDIFIAGKTDEEAVNKIETLYHVEINTVVYPENAFTQQKQFEPLLTEVKKNHIIWKNAETFVREILT